MVLFRHLYRYIISWQMRGWKEISNTASSFVGSRKTFNEIKDLNELPKYLIMENVPMLVSKKFIHSFNEWLEFLEAQGYKIIGNNLMQRIMEFLKQEIECS